MYNTGQTAVFLKDLSGKEYPAIAEVNRKKRVNGQRELSLSFLYTEINKDFMEQLEFGWKVFFDGEWYTITHPGYSTDGDFIKINATAILSFFVDLNGYYLQDKKDNESVTPSVFFSALFSGTPYNYALISNLAANTLSYQDNESKTARFLYGIDRYNAEYVVRGNVAYIYEQIGNNKDVILHEDLNVNNVRIDVDASGFHTWAKGYGDLPEETAAEEQEYQLEVEYVSPLAAKYGLIEGPAIKDGNYKDANNLTNAVKNQVENSYIISTEIETVDLTNNGYPEMVLEEGDRIWLYVSKLNLNQQVRVMEIDEYFDWEGNILNARYTVGNEGIASRYKTQQYNTLKDFQDILNGRKKLDFSWLPDAIKRASEIINGNQDSLFKYLPGEIIGINQNNPNGYMRFNTDGIGFSRDGGKTYQTAMTYEGIVAEAITAGLLNSNNVTVGNDKIQLNDQGIFVFRNNVLGASLVEGNLTFNDQTNAQRIGRFAATVWSDNVTKGISMNMEQNRYISFGHYIDEIVGYTPMMLLNPSTNMAGNARGIHMNLPIRMNDDVWLGNKSLRFGLNNTHNHAAIYKSNGDDLIVASYQSVGLAHIDSGGIANTKLSIHPNEVKVNVDTTFHGLNIRSYSDLWMGAKSIRFGDDPFHNHAVIRKTSGNDLALESYQGIGLSHLDTGGTPKTILSIDENSVDAWQDLDMHGWKILRVAEVQQSSSVLVKTNIQDYTERALDAVNNLQLKKFHYQSDIDQGIFNNEQIGLISELSPEVANQDQTAIIQTKLVHLHTKAIQELSTDLEITKQENQDLKLLVGELTEENELINHRLQSIEQRLSVLEAK